MVCQVQLLWHKQCMPAFSSVRQRARETRKERDFLKWAAEKQFPHHWINISTHHWNWYNQNKSDTDSAQCRLVEQQLTLQSHWLSRSVFPHEQLALPVTKHYQHHTWHDIFWFPYQSILHKDEHKNQNWSSSLIPFLLPPLNSSLSLSSLCLLHLLPPFFFSSLPCLNPDLEC